MDAPDFYARASLNVETYDSGTDMEILDGDVEFYLDLARSIEFSDFHRSPPAYAAEQVWVARRP